MRRNSIDNTRLYNRNFGLVCVAGFLLYASAYAVLLPLMRSGLAVEVCVPFLVGMQVVGPFHAWLADKFRRKHVLVYPFVGMLLVSVGYGYVSTPHQYSALALVQGMCFGLATSAAITLGIDVVHTGHRTKANMAYAFISRLGMAVGSVAGLWLMPINTYHWLGPVLAGAIGVLAASGLYVPFRAPIGLPVASADRYVLPRAVLPAFNVGLLAFACGMAALPMRGGMAWLYLLAALSPWLVRMFVKLSHHCQRATGNMTFNLFADAGVLLGAMAACCTGEVSPAVPLCLVAVSVLLYASVTRIYYKKMRVR